MPAHTSLKERTREQGDLSEQNKIDFRRDLLEREEALIVGKKRLRNDDNSIAQQPAAALQLMDIDEEEVMGYDDDESEEAGEGQDIQAGGVQDKRFKKSADAPIAQAAAAAPELELPLIENPFAQDADLDCDEFVGGHANFWTKPKGSLHQATKQQPAGGMDEDEDDSYGDEDDDDDESEDDDAEELMREYEKLKKEREEEKHLKELAKMEEIKRRQQEEVLHGNPLLNSQLSEATSLAGGSAAY